MISFPNAKLNLGLNIVRRRTDGYHDLATVFYPIPLEDALEFIDTPPKTPTHGIRLHQSGLSLDGDASDNLVVKAYRLLAADYPLPPLTAYLRKNIPSGAGLGGGSSDGAFMLRMLVERYRLDVDAAALESYASRLGADCAFFLRNRPVYAEGIGNRFTPFTIDLSGYGLLVVRPDVFVSTREAFARVVPHERPTDIRDVLRRPVGEWRDALVNDFEPSVFAAHPVLSEWKDALYRSGARYASMSGSGSALFGLYAPDSPLPRLGAPFEWSVRL
jgi:4-diphosphocytidyl-2-C-methyl-D-erythritol kinase